MACLSFVTVKFTKPDRFPTSGDWSEVALDRPANLLDVDAPVHRRLDFPRFGADSGSPNNSLPLRLQLERGLHQSPDPMEGIALW